MIETFEEMPKVKANGLNVLVLASVGDAAYTLAVREKLSFFDLKAGELSKRAAEKVCARAQAEKADRLSEVFSEEEEEIFRRGRNAKKGARAKHASVEDYNAATGLEAVFGYLALTGQRERFYYLFGYGEEDAK